MIIKYVLAIALLITLSLIYYLLKPIHTPKVLYIPAGSVHNIITHLESQNLDVTLLDLFLLRFIGSPQSGWIDIKSQSNTKADFLYKLTTAKAALQNVTLIPGETTYMFFLQLEKELDLNATLLQNAFKKHSPVEEGSLVPETYKLPKGITEEQLVKLLLQSAHKRHLALAQKFLGSYDQTKWFHYVAIASVIQKESANVEEMPLVSSVIHNRLKCNMPLQMDGTLNYGKYSHIRITPKRIKEDMSSYNTYKHRGVPSTPVCNVSEEAIEAAFLPAKSEYLYFMKNKKGTHDFSCNYSTHLKNIRYVTKRNKKRI